MTRRVPSGPHSRRLGRAVGRHRGISLLLVVVAVGAVLAWTVATDGRGTSPANVICHIDPPDGEAAITAAIAGCADGSTVRFPPDRSYTQAGKIQVTDRRNLVIDGNGSTFTTTARGRNFNGPHGNWVVLRGFNITLRNMTSKGSFTGYVGHPRSLALISPDPDFSEAAPNYGLYGVDTVHLIDVKGFYPWGDGVTTGPDEYVDGSTPDYTRNVFIKRMQVETTARHCWAPTSGTNIWIEDSSCTDAWYVGLDAEADNLIQPLQSHHYLRNTFSGFNTAGIFVPVAAADGSTRDFEIRDNVFLTSPDNKCAASIHIGGYPDSNPARFHNVVVTGNQIEHYGSAIVYDHVEGGSISGNILTRALVPGSTAEGYCGVGDASAAIRITNSANISEDANTLR